MLKTIITLSFILLISTAFGQETGSTMHLINFKEIFSSSPIIYSFLSFMSVSSVAIWLYSLITIRKSEMVPLIFCTSVRKHLLSKEYGLAEDLCRSDSSLIASLIQVGLTTKNFGAQVMIDAVKAEGKRVATPLWQRLSLLNDIAIVAPMIGLLGTVIGMFYAFYDVNRSVESINSLFDGLGIAVGTTVYGLIVAILAMLFSTTLKYRLVKTMSQIENESVALSSLIETGQG